MGTKPTVTLTFDGDEKKLTDSFARVGDASKSMGDTVRSSSSDFAAVGASTDDFVEKADGAESKAIGFTDTLSGVQGIMQGLNDESLTMTDRMAIMGQGAADLAGGFANLVIPAIGRFGSMLAATTVGTWAITAAKGAWATATGLVTTATGALNAVMRANPIMTVITIVGLLVGAFILLWNKSEGFRNFFIGMWNGIKSVVGGVVGWVVDRFNGLMSFFSNLPGRIGSAMGSLAGIVKGVFKGAVNGVGDALNWFLDHTVNWLINRFNDVSGLIGIPAIPTIPHIPRMHTGGIVPGLPGQEVVMRMQGGERVSTSGQGGGGMIVEFRGDVDSAFATAFMALVQRGDITVRLA